MESAVNVNKGPTVVENTSTNAWGKTNPMPWGSATSRCDPIVSLNDVMSEELAQQLQKEEEGVAEVKEELR